MKTLFLHQAGVLRKRLRDTHAGWPYTAQQYR